MTRLRQVFIPGGQPKITYVPRAAFHLETQVANYIETGHALFSVTGPTKSGKTVLCRNVVPQEKAIWLSGGEIAGDDDIWNNIIDELDQYTAISNESGSSQSKESSSELGAEARMPFIKGGGKLGEREGASQATRSTRSRTRSVIRTATAALLESKKILIIDDFHYIDRTTQMKVVRALKQPIFD